MADRYDSVLNGITDEEFEELLKECGVEYEKVEKGKGGLFIGGKRVTLEELDKIREIGL